MWTMKPSKTGPDLGWIVVKANRQTGLVT